MDQSYLGSRQKKLPIPLFITIGVIIAGGVIFFFATGKNELISPLPKQPSFEVVFYTPTPGAVTPTATPSATPKVKPTAAPTKALSPTPKVTSIATPSATAKPPATLTPKP